jgi:hypothetical protein
LQKTTGAITILAKTTQSDRPGENFNHPESQKLLNDKAIAILIKTTQSERSLIAKAQSP